MSFLTEALPLQIDHVPVNTDFRCMVEYETRLFDDSMPAEQIIGESLAAFFPLGYPGSWETAWKKLQWFYECGGAKRRHPGGKAGTQTERAYDFVEDGPLIYAAFQQAYGIDLTKEELHWWKFRALFEGLPPECRISKIMEYRVMDTHDMPASTRKRYEALKARYSLRKHRQKPVTVEQHEQEFIARLRREG